MLKRFTASGVRHQPLVVLAAVRGQVRGVRAVVTHVAQRDASGREASSGLLVARALIPVITDIYEGQFFEPNVGSGKLL